MIRRVSGMSRQSSKRQQTLTAMFSSSTKKPKVDAKCDDTDVPPPAPTSVVASSPVFADLEPGWRNILESESSKPYFARLFQFLASEEGKGKKVLPPRSQTFNAFNMCPYDKVRVVIIGQDPYHGIGQAHGLAFSVRKGVRIPPSLRNIFKHCAEDVGTNARPDHGCLEKWSSQGVLLLNTVLTVRKSEANSHKNRGWENFTDAVIRALNKERKGLVFLLWGKPAQKKAETVSTSKHLVIKSSHPSPLGATKTAEPFMSSRCFSRTNTYLKERGLPPIDWSV